MQTYVATEVLFPLDGSLQSVVTSHPKMKQDLLNYKHIEAHVLIDLNNIDNILIEMH